MRTAYRVANPSSQTVVRKYFKRLQETTGKRFKPVGRQWGSYCSRVIGFREREGLTWEEYEKLVDKIFDVLVNEQGYDPNFGMICSSQIFGVIKNGGKVGINYNRGSGK